MGKAAKVTTTVASAVGALGACAAFGWLVLFGRRARDVGVSPLAGMGGRRPATNGPPLHGHLRPHIVRS